MEDTKKNVFLQPQKKEMFFESRSGGMVDTRDLKSLAHCGRVGSSPTFGTQAEVAQLVEHNLAKVGVASSSLVFRSMVETSQCGVSTCFKQ